MHAGRLARQGGNFSFRDLWVPGTRGAALRIAEQHRHGIHIAHERCEENTPTASGTMESTMNARGAMESALHANGTTESALIAGGAV